MLTQSNKVIIDSEAEGGRTMNLLFRYRPSLLQMEEEART